MTSSEQQVVQETDAAAFESSPSWLSWVGLCAASFFLAEMNGVTLPFVNTYLLEQGWRYDTIGTAVALSGLVRLVVNFPGGVLIDRTRRQRLMLGALSLLVGGCVGSLPLVPATPLCVGALLVAAGVGKPLFGPLSNALTLRLFGHGRLDRAVGIKQAWNHAGNIAAALTAMALVQRFPVDAVFFAVMAASVMAAVSLLLVRPAELVAIGTNGDLMPAGQPKVRLADLLRDKRMALLLAAATLFHLANAPTMPLVAQKVKHVGGSNAQVAGVVLVAQSVMIPMAILAGVLGPRWGHKRVLAVGFLILPLRISLYTLTEDPGLLVALQALDGVGVGIFDVASIAICADVSRGSGRFNTLIGVLGTAVGVGGVAGPVASGVIVQHLGFGAAFGAFAIVAATAAVLFVGWMPVDRRAPVASHGDRLANPGVAMETD